MIQNYNDLEKILNLKFPNTTNLETALTHRSFLNETTDQNKKSNERMEFLGDSVLQFLTSKYLYNKYPNDPEGVLTSFRAATVNTISLSNEALRLNLGNFLFMSKGEESTGGRTRPYIMANSFEALLGCIYLEFGIGTCEDFLNRELFYKIDKIVTKKEYQDPKSSLQEITQEKFNITPTYKVLSEEGPDHNKNFTAGVFLETKKLAEGSGSSKKKAEENAAKKALEDLTSK